MGRSESGDPSLYIELRRKGEPINLLPWLAANHEKVSG
jgi:septal ring factor EnvC (AmiA/AmiB activator)